MTDVILSAVPKGNGYQAKLTLPNGVSISSAENYPSIAEAIQDAAKKLLEVPHRLEALDRETALLDRFK